MVLEAPLHSPRQEANTVSVRSEDTLGHLREGGHAVPPRMEQLTWIVVGVTGEHALLLAQSVAERTSTDSEFDAFTESLRDHGQ